MNSYEAMPLLKIKARNLGVASQFIIAMIILLAPLYWTPLTGYPLGPRISDPLDLDFFGDTPLWMTVGFAIICGVIGIGAIIPKAIVVSSTGIEYRERGRLRYALNWQDVAKVENCIRSIATRPATNIHFTTKAGKVYKLDSSKINDKALVQIYSVLYKDIAVRYPHLLFKDNGGWSRNG